MRHPRHMSRFTDLSTHRHTDTLRHACLCLCLCHRTQTQTQTQTQTPTQTQTQTQTRTHTHTQTLNRNHAITTAVTNRTRRQGSAAKE